MRSNKKNQNWSKNARVLKLHERCSKKRVSGRCSTGILLVLLLASMTLSIGCRKCPQYPLPPPPKVVRVEVRCMNPFPSELSRLAKEIKFPAPNDPTNPNSDFTLTKHTVMVIQWFLSDLADYLQIEYARCGKTTNP
jgi:hypothetical protein